MILSIGADGGGGGGGRHAPEQTDAREFCLIPAYLLQAHQSVLGHALDVVQVEVEDAFLFVVVVVVVVIVVVNVVVFPDPILIVVIFLVVVVVIISSSSSLSSSSTDGDTKGTFPSMVGAGAAFESFSSSSDSI